MSDLLSHILYSVWFGIGTVLNLVIILVVLGGLIGGIQYVLHRIAISIYPENPKAYRLAIVIGWILVIFVRTQLPTVGLPFHVIPQFLGLE